MEAAGRPRRVRTLVQAVAAAPIAQRAAVAGQRVRTLARKRVTAPVVQSRGLGRNRGGRGSLLTEPRASRATPSLMDQATDSHGILRRDTSASGQKRTVPSDSTSSESEVQGERAERTRRLERRGKRRLEIWPQQLAKEKQLLGLTTLEQRTEESRTKESYVQKLMPFAKWAEVDKAQDVLSAKFKGHVKSCQDLFVEVLLDGRAVPVSR